ncbi:amino acid ABC transporter permease [Mesorhizobium sp. M1A.F.Ca.ET.072.01.1.1]|uniref:amino acid ABC transporter permease n=1 Tax=Mesorhizobium sp. M1A.F.Ca.ET.072.01.1.1 TaxID=2496753 RepID=UPI000FD460FF|nr:amino acid ABC transporter permease [Mesorhizobium sp. M1A.F.Ca.ET.072.01.1.1]RUW49841.1 amino acid ABC transporter permease [Mesorhizobium sp. M1A.F.Ca.ET.072.01.1.1]TIU71806.1 MAG: amino acid ABC transporter permease [Mesorhizobium sp.]TIV04250.1 MAG: amino acid ABC transporter permease [Mesorhizobium sp.]
MSFDLGFAVDIIPLILKGISNTILVAILSFIGASLMGFILEMLRRSHWIIRPLAQLLIDAIRSTPIMVQLYFIYFVLPSYGITLPAFVTGVLGLSVYYSGYLSEVYKAGINAIPAGQSEAAFSLGLSWLDALIFVIAPQMLRNVAAPLGAYSVSILKATPYLAVISVPEMLGSAFDVSSATYRYAEPMAVAGLLFLALALIAVALVSQLECRLGLTAHTP